MYIIIINTIVYCSGRTFLKGVNDINTLYPHLVNSFDEEKNNAKESDCMASGRQYFWWVCEQNHSYRAKLIWRVEGLGCPYCSGHKVLAGFNDLGSNKKLSKYYAKDLNNVVAETVSAGSNQSFWWRCELGHCWQNTPAVLQGVDKACPYCGNRKFLSGFNDLKTVYPTLADCFDEEKNKFSASQQRCFGTDKVWWRCRECGLSWQATLDSRVKGAGCPGCSGYLAIPGRTDLLTTDSYIASLFDRDKNSIEITSLKRWSAVKVWWRCSRGHSYEEKVRSQTKSGYCRECLKESSFRSFLEYRVYCLVKTILKDSCSIVINSRKIIAPLELDLFFPELDKAIEVNGVYWHSEEVFKKNKDQDPKAKDELKKRLCRDIGIELLIIGEEEFNNEYERVEEKLRKFLLEYSVSRRNANEDN